MQHSSWQLSKTRNNYWRSRHRPPIKTVNHQLTSLKEHAQTLHSHSFCPFFFFFFYEQKGTLSVSHTFYDWEECSKRTMLLNKKCAADAWELISEDHLWPARGKPHLAKVSSSLCVLTDVLHTHAHYFETWTLPCRHDFKLKLKLEMLLWKPNHESILSFKQETFLQTWNQCGTLIETLTWAWNPDSKP